VAWAVSSGYENSNILSNSFSYFCNVSVRKSWAEQNRVNAFVSDEFSTNFNRFPLVFNNYYRQFILAGINYASMSLSICVRSMSKKNNFKRRIPSLINYLYYPHFLSLFNKQISIKSLFRAFSSATGFSGRILKSRHDFAGGDII